VISAEAVERACAAVREVFEAGAAPQEELPARLEQILALGRNTFDAPAAYCGMGGQNASEAHCDICCRNVSLDLDGQPIIRAEQFLVPELA